MCFGSTPQAAQPSAAPPPPPEPLAENIDPQGNRVAEDVQNYGTTNPDLRTDKSLQAPAGGTGLKM